MRQETAVSSSRVFSSEMVSFLSNTLKEARLSSWFQGALLILRPFNTGDHHAKLTQIQPVASSSSRDTEKTSESSTLTVNILIKSDVYGYCYYNDSMASNKTKRYETQYSILQKVKQQFAEKAREAGSPRDVVDLVYSNKDSDATEEELIKINEQNSDDNDDDKSYGSAPCAYFTGLSNYFNAHTFEYKAKWTEMKWNGPCVILLPNSGSKYHLSSEPTRIS
jgi:hypothetical protein